MNDQELESKLAALSEKLSLSEQFSESVVQNLPEMLSRGRQRLYALAATAVVVLAASVLVVAALQIEHVEKLEIAASTMPSTDQVPAIPPAGLTDVTSFYSEFDMVLASSIWGLIDQSGTMLIAPQFKSVTPFSEGLASVTYGRSFEPNKLYGYIDTSGEVVLDFQFLGAEPFSEGRAAVRTEAGWGHITAAGEFSTPPGYEWLGSFSEGVAPAKWNGKVGFVDLEGNVVIDFLYDGADEFHEELALVLLGERAGYIGHSGALVLPPVYEQGRPFSDGRASVKIDGLWGAIDTLGQLVIEPQYETLTEFQLGIAIATAEASLNMKVFKAIDLDGNTVVEFELRSAVLPSENLIVTQNDGLGPTQNYYYTLEGELALAPPEGWNTGVFHEGLAPVQVHGWKGDKSDSGRFGFINRSGELVVEPQYLSVGEFSEGVAWVAVPECQSLPVSK